MGGIEIPVAVSGCELKSRQEWGRTANKGNLGNAIFQRDLGLEISGKGVCVGRHRKPGWRERRIGCGNSGQGIRIWVKGKWDFVGGGSINLLAG